MGDVVAFPAKTSIGQTNQVNVLTSSNVREYALSLLPKLEESCNGQLTFTNINSTVERAADGFFIEARARIFIPRVKIGIRHDVQRY